MKTFGLFILLFLVIIIILSLLFDDWKSPEIIIESTLLAYIYQQYFTEENINK
jgi:regulatory protein YycI of two-component signal transduction system YycFG